MARLRYGDAARGLNPENKGTTTDIKDKIATAGRGIRRSLNAVFDPRSSAVSRRLFTW